MGRGHGWIPPVTIVMKRVVHTCCFQFSYTIHIFLLTILFLFNYTSSCKSFELGSSSGRQFSYISACLASRSTGCLFILQGCLSSGQPWEKEILSLCSKVQVCLLFRITLVHLACHNKISQARWLINNRHLLLTVLEAGSLRSGCQHGRVRALFPSCRLLIVSS